jgi:glutathione S-transferase
VTIPVLTIGNKNYSSWSLRPWLCLRWAGIAFREHLVRLDAPGYGQGGVAAVKAVSPSGTVPVLQVGTLTIWDSLAIAEWAAEQVSPGVLWPQEAARRAEARAATAEMHAGFAPVRRDLPMNIHRRCPPQPWAAETERSLARLTTLWEECRARYASEGPWLFGTRSIADAFYTPVATRLRSYGVALPAAAAAYRDTLLADADFLAWEADSQPNSWDVSGYSVIDRLYA